MYTFRVVRVFTATLAAISAAAQAGTIYVSTGGNDGNDGLTWASAKRTVQAAVNVAQSDDRVWVAAGTYMQRLSLRAGIALYGGFIGNETDLSQRDWTTNQTILDGNYGGSVVTVSSGSRVDGFIIRNGKSLYGGGIYCSGSVTITNNIITSNTVGMAPNFVGYGGGIYCSG
ncbi:MAG TPA: hypothetical protein VHP11_15795, partial [Tepidisphaeraceae bacterium]|nr:hypothetical protein [Tepidisphaeraceae bacterium]